jgi:hypothetical protein
MTESERAMDEKGEAERPAPVPRLKEAMRQARIELAERSAVIVDMRNAELARLQLLDEALDPIFAEIPPGIELFDRGVVPGDPPRLWIDMIAHVVMARDKRVYRFVQDTQYGRRILAESGEIDEIVEAVTRYVARRLVERERMLEGEAGLIEHDDLVPAARHRRRLWRVALAFVVGVAIGAAGLLAIAWLVGRHLGAG